MNEVEQLKKLTESLARLEEADTSVSRIGFKDYWLLDVKEAGLDYEGWGNAGSLAAFDDGRKVGEWIGEYDTQNGERAHGWLETQYAKRAEGMAEIDENKVTESSDSTLYVYDSGDVSELNTADKVAMQRFDNKYGFHEDSLFDFPVEYGVREFQSNGRTIIVSDDPQALAAAVENY
jgi:hypothetical protein